MSEFGFGFVNVVTFLLLALLFVFGDAPFRAVRPAPAARGREEFRL